MKRLSGMGLAIRLKVHLHPETIKKCISHDNETNANHIPKWNFFEHFGKVVAAPGTHLDVKQAKFTLRFYTWLVILLPNNLSVRMCSSSNILLIQEKSFSEAQAVSNTLKPWFQFRSSKSEIFIGAWKCYMTFAIICRLTLLTSVLNPLLSLKRRISLGLAGQFTQTNQIDWLYLSVKANLKFWKLLNDS